MKTRTGVLFVGLWIVALAQAFPALAGEMTEYEGQTISLFNRLYDNSIKGPQTVEREGFRLKVEGLVDKPLSLTYDEAVALDPVRRLVTMPCVEGWSERLVYDGLPVAALLERAGVRPEARWVVFRSADGYTTAFPLEYVREKKVLLGHHINGLTLDNKRGWPFQVVAGEKLGYKWAKWVVALELVEKEHRGYWESRGYSNDAPVKKPGPLLKE